MTTFGDCKALRRLQKMSEQNEAIDSIEAEINDLEAEVEDMEPLPTPDEADLGELCSKEPPTFEDLVDNDTSDLIEVLDGEGHWVDSDLVAKEELRAEWGGLFGGDI